MSPPAAALTPGSARAQTHEVVIGVIYPLSGASAQIGVDAQRAFETAADIINKNYDFALPGAKGEGFRDSAAPRFAWSSPIIRPIRRRAARRPSA